MASIFFIIKHVFYIMIKNKELLLDTFSSFQSHRVWVQLLNLYMFICLELDILHDTSKGPLLNHSYHYMSHCLNQEL